MINECKLIIVGPLASMEVPVSYVEWNITKDMDTGKKTHTGSLVLSDDVYLEEDDICSVRIEVFDQPGMKGMVKFIRGVVFIENGVPRTALRSSQKMEFYADRIE